MSIHTEDGKTTREPVSFPKIHANPKDEFLMKNLGKLGNFTGSLGAKSVSSVNLKQGSRMESSIWRASGFYIM